MDRRDANTLYLLGRNLAAERTRRGLTQEQVAHQLDMPMQQYSRMELGRHDTGVTKYVNAAHAIGVPVARVFEGVEPTEEDARS